MRRQLLSSVLVLFLVACASQASIVGPPPTSWTQGPDVSHLVPAQLSFATAFVQTLSDSGFSIQAVRLSIFNGGMMGTKKAAWVKTDKGILEVLFFEKPAAVEQIQIKEEEDSTPNYHKYTVKSGNESHPWEGRLPVYFAKYGNILIITYDGKSNDAIKSALGITGGQARPGRT